MLFPVRLFALLFLVAVGSPRATTVSYELVRCPVCAKQFAASEISSWFQFGEPDRDLSGSLFVAVSRLQSCPYCLYAAAPRDFGKLSPEEVTRVRMGLEDLGAQLRKAPKLNFSQSKLYRTTIYLLVAWVAEVCDSARTTNLKRSAELHFAEYQASKSPDVEGALPLETQRAAIAIEAALNEKAWTPDETPTWTYLAGELHRRVGNFDRAISRFEEAERLSNTDWISKWVKEQTAKARAGDSSSSGEKIRRKERKDVSAALRKQIPELLAAIDENKPADKWLLDGGLDGTVRRVEELAAEGNADAVNFLVHLLSKVTPRELKKEDGLDDAMSWILPTLSRQRMLLQGSTLDQLTFKSSVLRDAVDYSIKGTNISKSLEKAMASGRRLSGIASGVFNSATIHRDPKVKRLLVSRMEKSSGYSLDVAVETYFKNLGSPGDIPTLDVFAKKYAKDQRNPAKAHFDNGASERAGIEEAIRVIRLRDVFPEAFENRYIQ